MLYSVAVQSHYRAIHNQLSLDTLNFVDQIEPSVIYINSEFFEMFSTQKKKKECLHLLKNFCDLQQSFKIRFYKPIVYVEKMHSGVCYVPTLCCFWWKSNRELPKHVSKGQDVSPNSSAVGKNIAIIKAHFKILLR